MNANCICASYAFGRFCDLELNTYVDVTTVDRQYDIIFWVEGNRENLDWCKSKSKRVIRRIAGSWSSKVKDVKITPKDIKDLLISPFNELDTLKDYYSIRINDQWSIIFRWERESASLVEIVDYQALRKMKRLRNIHRVKS